MPAVHQERATSRTPLDPLGRDSLAAFFLPPALTGPTLTSSVFTYARVFRSELVPMLA
jgi:hypothetical protein